MGRGPDPGNADLLPPQIFQSLDRRLGQDTLRQNILLSADADELCGP